ncbi:MAG TPA: glycine cleavage system protein GcvH [Rhodocyclaceae bacterium]|nr:glycine cleavage system protein GcvH [Rhodocyclaceae bacterium]
MNIPDTLRYAASHEWARLDADGLITVGITDHAQSQLGDIVFLELPAIGRIVAAGEECAVVESVKAASDIYAPLAGEIVRINQEAVDNPELVNQDAYRHALFVLKPANPADLDTLLTPAQYRAQLEAEA